MKQLLLMLLLTSPFIGFGQDDSYAGKWSASGEGFENTMILEKIEGKKNIYKFSFSGWRTSYDSFTKRVTKFPGEMINDIFIIEIKDNLAHYNDDLLVLDEEFPIYNDGEERCNVYFQFIKNKILVKTEYCHLIYAGFGVSFAGIYERTK